MINQLFRKEDSSLFPITKNHIFVILTCIFLFSLIYSKFLTSLCMIGWFLLIWFDINISKSQFHVFIAKDNWEKIKSYPKARAFWAINSVFLVVIVSGLLSDNTQYWIHHLQLKLPFLILPFVFYRIGFITKKWIHVFHYVFVFVASLAAIHMSVAYALDFNAINIKVSRGQSFPTPIHHVSLSLMMAYAVISSLILWRRDEFIPVLKKCMGLVFILLFIFLHILAVRSGLVTCYIALFVYLMYEMIHAKSYKFGMIVISLCILSPIIAYKTVPSFYNKVSYARFDLSKWKRGNAINYSDGGRILSYKMGYDIFIQNKWVGAGIGDIKKAAEDWYITNVPEYKGKLNYPHNQILFALAATGLIGTFLYLFGLLFPFFSQRLFSDPFCLSLYTILFTSFIVESTLEHSYTIAFFLFFILIHLAGKKQAE